MQILKKVTVEQEVVDKTLCDVCKQEIKWIDGETHSEVGIYCEVMVGTDGGLATRVEYDVCPECFANKVIEAMSSIGASPRTTTGEY